jgi:hypothetical protein
MMPANSRQAMNPCKVLRQRNLTWNIWWSHSIDAIPTEVFPISKVLNNSESRVEILQASRAYLSLHVVASSART